MLHRRALLKTAGGIALGLAGGRIAAPAQRKKIAAVITEYRPTSHADVWITALLEGYLYNGRQRTPEVELVSMYTDQVPANDLSRAISAKHGFKIFPTIEQTLTIGTGKLTVEGVILMAEHGKYPSNEKGQMLYPRYEFYKQIIDVFQRSGRTVPVFCDKHLSYDWTKAKWMYDQSRELKFAFMAGSSAPLTWRRPALELDLETPVEKAVVVAHGPKESYGFHALEVLQCMVERRKGGETGIAAVHCLEGPAVWTWTDRNPWAQHLLEATLACMESRKPGTPRDNVKQPILFLLEYFSGLEAAVYILNGHVERRGFGAQIRGIKEAACTEFWTRYQKPWSHATGLTYYLEQLFVTGRTFYPVERTLLTTGALAALMDSGYDGSRRLETPHLNVTYRAPKESVFNRGPIPPVSEKA